MYNHVLTQNVKYLQFDQDGSEAMGSRIPKLQGPPTSIYKGYIVNVAMCNNAAMTTAVH